MKLPVLLYLIFALANAAFATSSASPHPSFIEAPAFDNEPLRQWLAETNANATVLQALWNEADWSWATDISPEHEAAGVAAAMRYQSFSLTAAAQAQVWLQRAAAASLVDSTLLRQTRMWASTDLPPLESDRQRLLERVKAMENMYSTARCAANNMTLGALSQVMGSSSDADTLLQSWRCWHDTARPMRPLYREFVSLANAGAAANGFADDGQFWRSFYDMPAADFGQLVESLWHEVKPLYVELHAYVRARLVEFYGEKVVNKSAAIPAHLLGNMWAQSWGNLYNIIPGMVPYPDVPSPPDASPFMKQKGLSSRDVVRIAERFFRSLGMRELPPSFWNLSLFDEPPAPRQAVCHASAWDFTNGAVDDVRLKMCVEITEEDLVTAHHELGHLYYDLSYKEQPFPFRTGANDGFHEGIGDTLALSCNSAYLRQIGILPPAPNPNPTAELQERVNSLMKMALEKVAFLPFGFAVDAYRWSVFNGSVPPSSYTASWWKLREQFQGIAPAVPRSDPLDFDAGAKYHVPANVPYMRYFIAHVLQFQFHAVLCDAAGHTGPLDSCNVYGSVAAGDILQQMLRSGASLPWQDVLRAMTGSSSMSTRPLLRYFKPLYDFLYRHNRLQPTAIGWGGDLYTSSPSSPAPQSRSSDFSSSVAGAATFGLALALIILWVAYKTRRQIRMRQRPILEFEDMNEFGYSLTGRNFNQI